MLPAYRFELLNISKSFGGIHALQDVTLKGKPGEIHALVGENGAGKSTLVKILSGACHKNSGTIKIDGVKVDINSPLNGRKAGIGIIYQEFSLVPELSVSENIFLHTLSDKGSFIKWREMNAKAEKLIGSLGFNINPRDKVSDLSIASQQVVEIAKALSENVKVLILDEPTAVLAPNETTLLFEIIRKLKQRGVSIIYISHRLEEVFDIADSITVIKDGRISGSSPVSRINKDDVIKLMIGRKLDVFYPKRDKIPGKEIFRAENICIKGKVNNVGFSVQEGEVLGITGLAGSGRTETIRAIFSADKKERGSLYFDEAEIKIETPAEAVRAGIGLVPEDRKTQGLILSLSIKNNISITTLDNLSNRLGIIRRSKEKRNITQLIQKLAIKTESPEKAVSDLSGGNQQKVVLAKWLAAGCKLLLLDEPTRGVDVGAKLEIYNLINELVDKGLTIVMISSDITEVIGMCDRILVMKQGEVKGILEKNEFSEENILRRSVG
jgi:ribose transport system ATP-binding protein